MKLATLPQGLKILEMVLEKRISPERLQNLLESGLLSDLLDGNVDGVDRDAFRHLLDLGSDNRNREIDCDAKPLVPDGLKVENHIRDGVLNWNLSAVVLHLSPNQQNGRVIKGHKLLKELEKEPVLNANVLDYLITYPELIPDDWKRIGWIFFWGTRYRDDAGGICIRHLFWSGYRWFWGCLWLDDEWNDRRYALIRRK